jgi:hypothetical protein
MQTPTPPEAVPFRVKEKGHPIRTIGGSAAGVLLAAALLVI